MKIEKYNFLAAALFEFPIHFSGSGYSSEPESSGRFHAKYAESRGHRAGYVLYLLILAPKIHRVKKFILGLP